MAFVSEMDAEPQTVAITIEFEGDGLIVGVERSGK